MRKKKEPVIGYKAFNKGMVCRDFKYEVGKTYTEEKSLKICNTGFHFCKNPLDIFGYYDLIDNNGNLTEFALVEAIGDVVTEGDKSATNKITIKTKLDIPAFVKASFDFMWEQNNKEDKDDSDSSRLATSGHSSRLATSGHSSQLATSGHSSQLATSGDYSRLATSGDYSQLATSGLSSRLATSGDSSQLATSGDYSQLATSGNYSRLATSGHYSQLEIKGKNSVGAAVGRDSMIKAVKGTWITLAEYNDNWEVICVKSAQVDGKNLKANKWYKLVKGEFEEQK